MERRHTNFALVTGVQTCVFRSDKVDKRYRRVSHRIQESSADLMQSADQSLSNRQEVKVYGARGVEFERYSALADRHMRLSLKVESTRSISSAMVQLMG